ncbi:hypothetical protein pdam_00001735 [Pocillopora damicornis]|uniref:Uncharacterized protein n=1 Tax=Pocillopora damicornis TaxID=46731 RepID=A0A3M6UPQ6_POCDA|nr:hypothetical protein pdam_00001735 [Pocillopora damicornis]
MTCNVSETDSCGEGGICVSSVRGLCFQRWRSLRSTKNSHGLFCSGFFLLAVFSARFGKVPSSLRMVLSTALPPCLSHRWHRRAGCAPSSSSRSKRLTIHGTEFYQGMISKEG